MSRKKNISQSVKMSPEAWALLDQIAGTSVNKSALTTRMLQFFADSDREVQQAFLHPEGDPAAEMVKLHLAKIAGTNAAVELLDGKLTIEQAARLIRNLTDYIERAASVFATLAKSNAKQG